MRVLITEEGCRTAAILGYLQPLRVRPEPARRDGWVTATCRLLTPQDLREQVAALALQTARLYQP